MDIQPQAMGNDVYITDASCRVCGIVGNNTAGCYTEYCPSN